MKAFISDLLDYFNDEVVWLSLVILAGNAFYFADMFNKVL